MLSRANRVGMMYAPLAYSNPYLFRDVLEYAPGFPPPAELASWHADKARGDWPPSKRLRVALFHYVFWNDWVDAYADFSYPVEGFDADALVRRAGLVASRRPTRAPKTDANHFDLLPELANLTWADLAAVSPAVHARATAIARNHGYDV